MIFRIVGRFAHGFCSAVWTGRESAGVGYAIAWACHLELSYRSAVWTADTSWCRSSARRGNAEWFGYADCLGLRAKHICVTDDFLHSLSICPRLLLRCLDSGRANPWFGYAIALGALSPCGLRVDFFDFVCGLEHEFCPIAAIASWACVLASPKYRAR